MAVEVDMRAAVGRQPAAQSVADTWPCQRQQFPCREEAPT